MNGNRLDRRSFLAATSVGLGVGLAGCSAPQASDSAAESASHAIDRNDEAEGSEYTDVYEAVIDAVTQVQVLGISDPTTGRRGEGQGSGFLFDDSHVVTNDHVVESGESVDLQYINGDWTATRLVGTDAYSDLAVLEVDHVPDAATPLSLVDKRPVVGQKVLAIGNPFGLQGTMTQGIVSGVDRTIATRDRDFSFSNVVQTDAAVNPGNSGGPLVDLEGRVVGVVNAGGGDNVGFAVSAAMTSRVVPALIERGEYDHPFVGIDLVTVDRRTAEANDLPEITGVIVTGVAPGEAAAGVLEPATPRRSDGVPVGGDVIFAIDGEPIPDRHALSTYLDLETRPGETIEIECWRDGRTTTLTLTLGTRPTR